MIIYLQNNIITKLAKKTRKCNMKDRQCDILLTHSDGSKHKKVRERHLVDNVF